MDLFKGQQSDLTIPLVISATHFSIEYKLPKPGSVIFATARIYDSSLWI